VPSFFVGALLACSTALHASSIYRCGTEYTNQPTPAQTRECERISGPSPEEEKRLNARSEPLAKPTSPGGASGVRPPVVARIDPAEQRQRDAQARAILEAELRKTQATQAQMQRELSAAPAPSATRSTELRASIARLERDTQSLQRELSRLTAP